MFWQLDFRSGTHCVYCAFSSSLYRWALDPAIVTSILIAFVRQWYLDITNWHWGFRNQSSGVFNLLIYPLFDLGCLLLPLWFLFSSSIKWEYLHHGLIISIKLFIPQLEHYVLQWMTAFCSSSGGGSNCLFFFVICSLYLN